MVFGLGGGREEERRGEPAIPGCWGRGVREGSVYAVYVYRCACTDAVYMQQGSRWLMSRKKVVMGGPRDVRLSACQVGQASKKAENGYSL